MASNPTPLDLFEPKGDPIHPLDLHALFEEDSVFEIVERSPAPADEADYQRNQSKTGNNVRFNGIARFCTATIEPVTEEGRKLRDSLKHGKNL